MKIHNFITDLSANGKRYFTISEIKKALGKSDQSVWNSLNRLKDKGELSSPAKGFYIIIPPEYRILGCLPPELFIQELMAHVGMPYYVCLQTASMYHGASHQQVQIFYVMVPKNRPTIRCGKVRIEFIAKQELASTPVQKIKTAAGYMNVSTPEATAMDLILYSRTCGGLNTVFTILEELAEKMKPEPLKALADKSSEIYWIQRLGFLLDEHGQSELSEILNKYLMQHHTKIIPLAPYLPMKSAKRNMKWRISINVDLESDL